MAGFLEGLGRTIGGLQAGVLDARNTIQAKHQSLLDNVLRGRSEQRAVAAGGFTQQQLGHGPIMLDSLTGPGQEQIAAGRGLLADPRFQDNRTELKFAASLMSNPETATLGQSMLGTVISQQQQQDAQLRRETTSDAAVVEAAAIKAIEKDRDVALQINDDFRKEAGPIAEQIPEFQGFINTLASGSSTDALAGAFQFFNIVEPGGITRDDERSAFQGSGGLFTTLANTMNAIEGQGMKPELRRKLAATVLQIMQPRFDRLGGIQAEFQQIGAEAGLQGDLLNLTTRGVGANLQPQIPEALLTGPGSNAGGGGGGGGGVVPPPPPGFELQDQSRRRSVREIRGR